MPLKTILVDMDGVLADFENGFIVEYRKTFPTLTPIPVGERKNFYVTSDYPSEMQKNVESVYHTPGFFENLPVIPGGKESLELMSSLGHQVFICTSPLTRYDDCVLEKYNWVAKNLGYEWTRKMIVTSDKTLVQGDILIDDKPYPHGVGIASWEHVLYDAPYNKNIPEKRRITWDTWSLVLSELTKRSNTVSLYSEQLR